MARDILQQCTPRMIQVDGSCGCTLTRASIKPWLPADIEGNDWKESGMNNVLANAKEGRMIGVPQRALTDLLLSRMTPIKRIPLMGSGSVIAPWVYSERETLVNSNYFRVTGGAATPGAGVGSIPASAWNLEIANDNSQFATQLEQLHNYFLPGRYVSISFKDGAGVGHTMQFRIISAVPKADNGGDSLSPSRATVTVQPSITDAYFNAQGDKAPYQPTHGLLIPLQNSVSNYESWCHQIPAENTKRMKVNWLQTFRRTHCYTDQYLQALESAHLDPMFKRLRTVPMAKQKKRQMAESERAWYNTVFFGDRINDKQDVATFEQLEQVFDPANPDCLLEYKANTIGILNQLKDCGRVGDHQGGALDFDALREELWMLKRYRSSSGDDNVDTIDCFTDRFTASNIHSLMMAYYRDKYGVTNTRYWEPKSPITFENQVLWNTVRYQFPEEGLDLVVIHETFFDDYLSAMPAVDKSMGRWMFFVDWSDISIGLGQAKSVNRKTNEADSLYNCVITPVVTQYALYSEQFTVLIGDENRHLIKTNFSDECPSMSVSNCVPGGYES